MPTQRATGASTANFAQHLIGIARRLYAEEPLGIELKDTVYALDSTTIDLCLSVFSWAPFRSTKAAVKLHTLLDLRGSIPSFIFISDGKFHDVNVLDYLVPEPGAFYIMDRAYIDFERLARLNDAGSLFVTAPSRTSEHSAAIRAPSTEARGSSATRPWCSPAFTHARVSRLRCAASSSMLPKPESGSYFSRTTSHYPHSRSPSFTGYASASLVLFEVWPQKVYRPRSSEGSTRMKNFTLIPKGLTVPGGPRTTQTISSSRGERVTIAA